MMACENKADLQRTGHPCVERQEQRKGFQDLYPFPSGFSTFQESCSKLCSFQKVVHFEWVEAIV